MFSLPALVMTVAVPPPPPQHLEFSAGMCHGPFSNRVIHTVDFVIAFYRERRNKEEKGNLKKGEENETICEKSKQ